MISQISRMTKMQKFLMWLMLKKLLLIRKFVVANSLFFVSNRNSAFWLFLFLIFQLRCLFRNWVFWCFNFSWNRIFFFFIFLMIWIFFIFENCSSNDFCCWKKWLVFYMKWSHFCRQNVFENLICFLLKWRMLMSTNFELSCSGKKYCCLYRCSTFEKRFLFSNLNEC